MQTTSHFVGIELKPEVFSDIFVAVQKYLDENNISKILQFQNPLSPHITLYYFEKELSEFDKNTIKNLVSRFDVSSQIFVSRRQYFLREQTKCILYFDPQAYLDLEKYRNILDKEFDRRNIENNNLGFVPHITFARIIHPKIFEKHRQKIEGIIEREVLNIKNINSNKGIISLYAVNSQFSPEIQIQI
ncbi:hypothetical protein N9J72_01200 [Candidatus Gracilibacteria bacterium]|nr:hypothetical protein [Candidatus Gracilibacteria bacterium]